MEDCLFLPSKGTLQHTNEGTPRKRVVVYGTGSSARYFIQQYQAHCDIVVVTDAEITTLQFERIPIASTPEALKYDYDGVVVASWAISDIAQRLVKCGVNDEKIFWFQHNKNRVVKHDHPDALSAHRELAPAQILYAFYDLNVARATFDILGFLCLAERQRKLSGCDGLHVVVVNASNNNFNVAARGIISTHEHIWRKRQILAQCCGLLPSCTGFSFTSTREEAADIQRRSSHLFPVGYDVEQPVACWEFDNLFKVIEKGEPIAYLSASPQAKQLVQQFLNSVNPAENGHTKQVVCMTLRESDIKPARNSLFEEWQAFINQLDKNIYFPLILPDTDNSWSPDLQALIDSTGCVVYREPCFNVELRMALYELSDVNLGVNNGPMHLCALSPRCRYIMYKQVTEDYAHTSTQSFIDRGFTIGQDFPGANSLQKLVWQDDTRDIIQESFEALVKEIAKVDKC